MKGNLPQMREIVARHAFVPHPRLNQYNPHRIPETGFLYCFELFRGYPALFPGSSWTCNKQQDDPIHQKSPE